MSFGNRLSDRPASVSPVVRQSQRHLRPANPRAVQVVSRSAGVDHHEAVWTGEPLDLLGRHIIHAALWLGRAVPKRNRQQSARLKQRDELAEGTRSVSRRQMLPDAAQQGNIGSDAKAQRGRMRRQTSRLASVCGHPDVVAVRGGASRTRARSPPPRDPS
jgi:hypothetical protein